MKARLHPALTVLAALTLVLPFTARAQTPSVYDFEQSFTDQDGHPTTLAALGGGHPTLITMFYGSCPTACPLLVSRMKRLEAKLSEEQRAQVRVILVSIDPKRDTVEVLKTLQQAHHVDPTRWSMLRTDDQDAVRELAAVLGISYRFLPNGMINHSAVLTLLDDEGVPVARMDSLDQPEDALLQALKEATTRKAQDGASRR